METTVAQDNTQKKKSGRKPSKAKTVVVEEVVAVETPVEIETAPEQAVLEETVIDAEGAVAEETVAVAEPEVAEETVAEQESMAEEKPVVKKGRGGGRRKKIIEEIAVDSTVDVPVEAHEIVGECHCGHEHHQPAESVVQVPQKAKRGRKSKKEKEQEEEAAKAAEAAASSAKKHRYKFLEFEPEILQLIAQFVVSNTRSNIDCPLEDVSVIHDQHEELGMKDSNDYLIVLFEFVDKTKDIVYIHIPTALIWLYVEYLSTTKLVNIPTTEEEQKIHRDYINMIKYQIYLIQRRRAMMKSSPVTFTRQFTVTQPSHAAPTTPAPVPAPAPVKPQRGRRTKAQMAQHA